MTERALDIAGLTRTFRVGVLRRRRTVLDGVDLALERGRVLGLVGPNGSGKSTLLRLVAGTDRPSAGRLAVLGGTPGSDAVRQRVGWVPEDSPFPGELSAASAMELLGALHGLPRRTVRARGAALLERVGLAAHARVLLRRYSRGMLRRFALAQALLHEPELLLLDEPTAGLDGQGFEVLDGLLAEARARGRTVVMSTHLLSDVHAHCDELCVLLGGRVAAHGDPGHLLGGDGRTQLLVEGLDPEREAALAHWLAEQGARLVSSRPSPGALLELYRRLGATPSLSAAHAASAGDGANAASPPSASSASTSGASSAASTAGTSSTADASGASGTSSISSASGGRDVADVPNVSDAGEREDGARGGEGG